MGILSSARSCKLLGWGVVLICGIPQSSQADTEERGWEEYLQFNVFAIDVWESKNGDTYYRYIL